jgi:surfeit locus 1 family protein
MWRCAAGSKQNARSFSTIAFIGNKPVLINRGWIAATANHQHPPEVSTPQGTVELRGIAVVPSQRVFALAPETPGWHSVWQNLDLESWGDAVGDRPLPVVIQLDADSPAGFAREWPRPDERMEQNLSYAFQWRGFAIALVGFWLVASTRRRTQ